MSDSRAVCGAADTIHVTERDAFTGEATSQSYCETHAPDITEGILFDELTQIIPGVRRLLEFLKAHQRPPTPDEAEQQDLPLGVLVDLITDDLTEQIAQLELFLHLCDR